MFFIFKAEIQFFLLKKIFQLSQVRPTVAVIYYSPMHNQKIKDYLKIINQLGNKFIIGRNYNSKNSIWRSRLKENNCIMQQLCYQSTGNPTYWPHTKECLLGV